MWVFSSDLREQRGMPDRERKRVPGDRSGLLKGLVVALRVLLTVLGTWKIQVSEAERGRVVNK